jgi:hypothetical protein
VNRAGVVTFVVALILVLGLVVAFFIHVELVARPAYEEQMNRPNTTHRPGQASLDDPRYQHCVELRRIRSRWWSDGPVGAGMIEKVDERYQRECPDHGLDDRPDIQWSPDLPPEPPTRP